MSNVYYICCFLWYRWMLNITFFSYLCVRRRTFGWHTYILFYSLQSVPSQWTNCIIFLIFLNALVVIGQVMISHLFVRQESYKSSTIAVVLNAIGYLERLKSLLRMWNVNVSYSITQKKFTTNVYSLQPHQRQFSPYEDEKTVDYTVTNLPSSPNLFFLGPHLKLWFMLQSHTKTYGFLTGRNRALAYQRLKTFHMWLRH